MEKRPYVSCKQIFKGTLKLHFYNVQDILSFNCHTTSKTTVHLHVTDQILMTKI
jgi:hypothetical protein